MTRRMSGLKHAAPAAVVTLAAALTLAGCGSDSQSTYCADKNGKVVDDSNCDSSRGGAGYPFFLYTGSFGRSYGVGQTIPNIGNYQRIAPNDTSARSKAGLSSTGKVGNGSSVKGSSGGFGSKGGSGSHGSSGG